MNAITPDFYFKNMPSLQKADEEAKKKGATEEERQLYSMTLTAGWKGFKEIADQLYRDLGEVNKTAISAGAPLEEIGRNTVVVSLTQDILDKLFIKVSDAVEACTQNEQ